MCKFFKIFGTLPFFRKKTRARNLWHIPPWNLDLIIPGPYLTRKFLEGKIWCAKPEKIDSFWNFVKFSKKTTWAHMKEHLKKRSSSEFQPNRTNIERVMSKNAEIFKVHPSKTPIFCFLTWNVSREMSTWSHTREHLTRHLRSDFRANRTNTGRFTSKNAEIFKVHPSCKKFFFRPYGF